jgi:hypothetical protein
MYGVGLVERAFDLARSGKYASPAEIRCRLKEEGYTSSDLQGRFLASQLRKVINTTRLNGRTVKLASGDAHKF